MIVKTSKIDGKGVFADKDYKKGEVVIRWDLAHVLSEKEAQKVPDGKKKYVISFKGKFLFLQPPERYLNHCCEANTTIVDFCDVAKKDIKKGEEITADYSENILEGIKIKCKCENKNCRGWIERR